MRPKRYLMVGMRAISPRNGFSLVEMLTVLAIITILTAASTSAFFKMKASLDLSSGAQMVVSELSLARQTALTLNQTVEVRFYQFPDRNGTGTQQIQALQLFSINNGVDTPLDKIAFLPPEIMISSNQKYSAPLAEIGRAHV